MQVCVCMNVQSGSLEGPYVSFVVHSVRLVVFFFSVWHRPQKTPKRGNKSSQGEPELVSATFYFSTTSLKLYFGGQGIWAQLPYLCTKYWRFHG